VFEENIFTQRGQALHKRVDDPGFEVRDGLRIERALPLFCDRLGLVGKADVVEFLPDGTPYPVEYKHGSRHKRADIAACDDLQLAAQALCLEEMFGKPVPEGALYYASSRRRRIVAVDANLRAKIELTVAAVRQLLRSGEMPPPLNDDHCHACSLRDLCQPEALAPTPEHSAVRHSLFEVDD
jgi:CRISPR-associated exonuclease Cas4